MFFSGTGTYPEIYITAWQYANDRERKTNFLICYAEKPIDLTAGLQSGNYVDRLTFFNFKDKR